MPKINEILLKLEGFKYATSLDLKMGYYHIQLSEDASNLYTIILLWGKYYYQCLPMLVSNSTDIFQQNINGLFQGFYFIVVYMYYFLIMTKGCWVDHIERM